MTKKVVLVAPANDFAGNLNVVRFTTLLAPPMGILAIGSYLAARGVSVELIDVQMDFGFGLTYDAEHLVSQRVARSLRNQASEIAWIGISQVSNSSNGIALAQEIHSVLPDTPLILGGYFPSTTYRTLLKKHPFIAAIVRGDGEVASLEISRSLAQGCSFPSDAVPNLAWLDGGQVRTTATQPMAIDDLPILDFRLLHNPYSYQIVDLMTSRGCPFRCNYCLESSMRPYATHSPEWVDRQLTHLETELPNDRVFIYDPVFGLGRERTLEVCRVLSEHRFTYASESRVDVLAPDLVPVLRKAGIETIYFGIESASPTTLMRMSKLRSRASANHYLKNALEVLRSCFENDVTPVLGFMLSFPGDTEDDYRITLEFVREIGQLHDQVAAQTGVETGFIPFAFYTKVYDGSSLAECVAEDYPEATLRAEPFVGERTVLSPSPGLDMDVTQRYQAEIVRRGTYTPMALERLWHYFSFSMEAFLVDHPDLKSEEEVITLGDSLRRFPQAFSIASVEMLYDKSRR
jgi:anaerobic magnesium-protoporphyrin IX monomethyl ester cyclase